MNLMVLLVGVVQPVQGEVLVIEGKFVGKVIIT